MTHWSTARVVLVAIFAVATGVLGVTQNSFNQPPEGSFFRQFIGGEMVVISTGQYGQFIWFILSTLGAATTLLCVARLLPVTRFMRLCGDHSLVLLGLNGIFLNVLNVRITSVLQPGTDHAAMVMLYAVIISALTLLVCLPLAMALEKLLPQLTGRPMLAGPVLPALYKK
jgi:fucose 4-O-acetylase-like acetyltransferase